MQNDKLIGVTIITGFLGSGKTTLLSEILSSDLHGKRIAVVENEFGTPLGVQNEVTKGLDNAAAVAEIYETTNGCLCCSGRGDFVNVLGTLCVNKEKFDYIIVETTGLADPTFCSVFEEPEFKKHLFLDGIITMIDAKNVHKHLNRTPSNKEADIQIINECIEQIAFADKLIINKLDLVTDTELKDLEQKIKNINPTAEIIKTKYSKIEALDQILNIKSYSLDKILKTDPGFLKFRPYRQHDAAIGSVTLTCAEDLDLDTFSAWLKQFLHQKEHSIFRVKGVLSVKDKTIKMILQGVHDHFGIQEHLPWAAEQRQTKIVFIGKNLDPQEIIASGNTANSVNFQREIIPGDVPPPSFTKLFVLMFLIFYLVYPEQLNEYVSANVLYGSALACFVLYKFLTKPKPKQQ